ncbi:hypothetical protein [Paenarthrobacter nicotinovorans]|uniref:hypothetical protein n=1 Tax=Paenarthrobacter nicotinovorans TaxID=29320 RepID=UPI0009A88DE7|nr:hypothetical protein [Paenarthrobacter nicotinovorans]MDI2019810.1 hypothetical protein [Paenarthrobacter nicotinovorans]SKB71277.1 hypothetical protein SAMN05660916_02247 [Arthrobacter sp. 31Cvi3.1E]
MQWDLGDGRHEGTASMVAPDGRLSHEVGESGLLVSGITGRFPRDAEKRDHEVIDDDHVVGWQASCSCGWKGRFWTRVATRSEANLDDHSAYVPFLGFATPPVAAEDAMKVEWRAHAEASSAIDELLAAQRSIRTAKARLDNAVSRSRAVGLPWSAIASTLEITRQSAHARWGKTDP